MRKIGKILRLTLLVLFVLVAMPSRAQHTLSVTGGTGFSMARFYPVQEMKTLFGGKNFGLSWRYYSLPRGIGAVGLDLEFMERGFTYGYAYSITMGDNGEELREYAYYTRRLNSIMLPIVWQPHLYLAKRHIRLYLDAALTLSYNFGGGYEYSNNDQKGPYDWRLERDNRWNYGLAGGLGVAFLFGRYELGLRARYYFGYADLMRNMNKYYNNATDGPENPFRMTPLRSPIDNLNFSITLGYRFNKEGFTQWFQAPPKRDRSEKEFRFNQSTSRGR